MNESNRAECLALAATCEGAIVQLESCPLQFACEGNENDGYDPCAAKACGDTCTVCAPDDTDCVETAVVKMCDAEGECSATAPSCK